MPFDGERADLLRRIDALTGSRNKVHWITIAPLLLQDIAYYLRKQADGEAQPAASVVAEDTPADPQPVQVEASSEQDDPAEELLRALDTMYRYSSDEGCPLFESHRFVRPNRAIDVVRVWLEDMAAGPARKARELGREAVDYRLPLIAIMNALDVHMPPAGSALLDQLRQIAATAGYPWLKSAAPQVGASSEAPQAETLPDDYEWAHARVVKMAAMALVNAQVYGRKILKGFGYPDETMSHAQDARALQIVLSASPTVDREASSVTGEADQ